MVQLWKVDVDPVPLWLDLSDNLRVDVRCAPALPPGRNEHRLHIFRPISSPNSSDSNDWYDEFYRDLDI